MVLHYAGGEGLPRVAQTICFQTSSGLDFVHFNDAVLETDFNSHGTLRLKERTAYPFGDSVRLTVLTNALDFSPRLCFFAPTWTSRPQVLINGHVADTTTENGFVTLQTVLRTGDVIEYKFTLRSGEMPVQGSLSDPGFSTLYYGPLLLACSQADDPVLPNQPNIPRVSDCQFRVAGLPEDFSTVYHLLNPRVNAVSHYGVRMLFRSSNTITAACQPNWQSITIKLN